MYEICYRELLQTAGYANEKQISKCSTSGKWHALLFEKCIKVLARRLLWIPASTGTRIKIVNGSADFIKEAWANLRWDEFCFSFDFCPKLLIFEVQKFRPFQKVRIWSKKYNISANLISVQNKIFVYLFENWRAKIKRRLETTNSTMCYLRSTTAMTVSWYINSRINTVENFILFK